MKLKRIFSIFLILLILAGSGCDKQTPSDDTPVGLTASVTETDSLIVYLDLLPAALYEEGRRFLIKAVCDILYQGKNVSKIMLTVIKGGWKMYSNKHVLLIGGGGTLGSYTAKELLKLG